MNEHMIVKTFKKKICQVAYLLGLELVSGVLDPVEDLEMLGLLVTGHLLHLAGVLPHLSQVLRG